MLRRALQDATVIVAPVHELDDFGAEELAGKTIVTSTVNDRRIAQFKEKGVNLVIDGSPMLFDHVLGPSLLDAMIIAATEKAPDDILEDDYLEIITGLELEPRIIYPNGFKRVNRFAFVIHPLSQEYFKNIKPIELLSRVSPPVFMDTVEKAMAYAPPFVYSKVTGIKSPTGVEAEGLADLRWRDAQGDHEPQPRVHLSPPARRGPDGQAARRADHGPRRIHQGRRRCRPHRRQARAAADHDGQQLQRIRRRSGPRTTPCCASASCPRRSADRRCRSRRWSWAPPEPSASAFGASERWLTVVR